MKIGAATLPLVADVIIAAITYAASHYMKRHIYYILRYYAAAAG